MAAAAAADIAAAMSLSLLLPRRFELLELLLLLFLPMRVFAEAESTEESCGAVDIARGLHLRLHRLPDMASVLRNSYTIQQLGSVSLTG